MVLDFFSGLLVTIHQHILRTLHYFVDGATLVYLYCHTINLLVSVPCDNRLAVESSETHFLKELILHVLLFAAGNSGSKPDNFTVLGLGDKLVTLVDGNLVCFVNQKNILVANLFRQRTQLHNSVFEVRVLLCEVV